ncbi:porin family protein [Sunxiuqinia sp. A32]|uniref:porin family protein n=1 Tax=Sunxiuqinia sp. A32 TaxID=3461496 RepID=UPI00404679AB
MKKLICLSICTLITIWAFPQRNVQMSFLASPSINWMSSDQKEVNKNGATAGFDFGVNADIFFDQDNKYAFTTGLLITNTGGRFDYFTTAPFEFAGETLPLGSTIRYRLQYVEVPMAIKLKTSPFQRWTYWGQFGLSSFINVRARGDSDNGILDKTNINEEVNLFNIALNIGVGSEFDLGGNNAIAIGLIYKNGFLDVTSDNAFNERSTLNSIALKLGLVF